MDKNSGNIIRINYIFSEFKTKNRSKIKPTGFIVGTENIYLSTNNGQLLVIDITNGKNKFTLKIDNKKITKPTVVNKNLFVITDNSIIKLN